MNAFPQPFAEGVVAAGHSHALVTASYRPDLERCRLLCETVDRQVTGIGTHYLLVEHGDVAAFRELEGPNRVVVDERDILPRWLHSMRDPTSLFRRRLWLSTRTAALRGWHVQQLRRLAIAAHVEADALVFCDSDVVFLKPFDCARFWRGGRLRLFRRDGALAAPHLELQRRWSAAAGRALGLTASSGHDYISTLIAWRVETVRAMTEHIEALHGRHWIEVFAGTRDMSECMLYGRFVDEVLDGAGHFVDDAEFCRVYWDGPALDDAGLRDFIASLGPDQAAIGMQSFVGTDLSRIRRLVGA
ncbi:MAG: DUF6492 family protein [Rhizobiaceae bacterium]|nr:DUF6492 family protein [Rhizobiaceae bacterium]MCV0406074.1 DUF6492 family protein [Rhizobiaceae bacterium]